MPYITKISAQKNNTERVNIFLDEKYDFSVDLDVLVQHDLKKGKELDEADIIEIQFGDSVKKGFQQAVDYLSYRMRSVKEVTDYLTKKEIPAPAISEIIHKLKHYKYVNDLEFAEAYVSTHRKTNSKGPSVLKKELKLKGIDDDTIEQALSQYPDDLQLEEAVKQVLKLVKKEKIVLQKRSSSASSCSYSERDFRLRSLIKPFKKPMMDKKRKRKKKPSFICWRRQNAR